MNLAPASAPACQQDSYIEDIINNFHDVYNKDLQQTPTPFYADGEYMRTMEFKFALKK